MANSNVTKRVLANSLKELVQEIPLEKITIADICASSGMNRKSFYYHFRDKYDLIAWDYARKAEKPCDNFIRREFLASVEGQGKTGEEQVAYLLYYRGFRALTDSETYVIEAVVKYNGEECAQRYRKQLITCGKDFLLFLQCKITRNRTAADEESQSRKENNRGNIV